MGPTWGIGSLIEMRGEMARSLLQHTGPLLSSTKAKALRVLESVMAKDGANDDLKNSRPKG
jgi:hypothetical protein